MLGWDITDFGSGDFYKIGLLIFTIKNGNFNDGKYVKTYAEKLIIVEENQVATYHFYWSKMEDIINRMQFGGYPQCFRSSCKIIETIPNFA